MEIILLQDVKNLGYKNNKINVKNGYANNYLIPNGLAILATKANKIILEQTLKQQVYKEQKLRDTAEALMKKLTKSTLKIAAKVSSTGKIFGSVNNIQISEALKNQHDIDIDRKKITIETIKEVGTYKATVVLYKDIIAECEFEVIAEEK